ncbi:protein FAR-RED IMPAIRED RESPONSE 1-like [Lactuca sativa]|uniref:protein FAR-RED IMPAIRED RESPONSE 1-like n=1 Tax=Lactuca sativa TaxID=4236 RepID=UPI0022AF46B1|nr:protein FAR-RED IMPAIRED RESPONSE 1-like [Lactuca sativa]
MEKANYAEFGDVISYRMVFVLFTTIDHHKKSVTIGSGLLRNESIESYSWLLKAFLKTHGKEPTLVLTDQDVAIKQAVENVFRNSKHRLCMWHIVKNLKKKISNDLFTNTDFTKRFSKLVWDINMKPDVFEVKWGLLMKEFNLEDTRWFKYMFTIRDSWIPGYFSDIPMCGLIKTTSRSENGWEVYIVQHNNSESDFKNEFKVEIKVEEKEINCSCEHFKRMGVLCRHAFTRMMRCGVKEILGRYILKRWRKDVISRNYRFSSVQSDSVDCENVKLVNDSYYSFESCLDIVRDDKKRLALFAEKQQILLKEFESDYISPGLKSKTDGEVVCKLLGVTIPIPEEINIHVPEVQSNKGSGVKKRIPSAGEVAYENCRKEHRMCSGCGKRVLHNLRTCPERVGAAKSTKDNKNKKQ